MAVFLITFDLNHADGFDHYKTFTEELGKMRAHRIQNNACLVNVRSGSAKAVVDHLKPHIEDTDRLFAARVSSETSYFTHAYPGTNEWIEKNPFDGEPEPAAPKH